MNYQETIDFLYSQLPAYQRIGKAAYKANLDTTIALDSYFGHPHKLFRTIHVAGTNGKGSVAHMIASILTEAGYRTGLYTSPHLRDFRERIRIDGKMMEKDEVVQFVDNHRSAIERFAPSFFEMTVAMAFDYFARHEVDVAVVEVGMGGRLDSTNIITPLVTVITNIGHDHIEFLGPELSDVAREKGGTIKPGVPVVIGETAPFSEPVFRSIAEEKKTTIEFADREFRCEMGDTDSLTGIREFMVFNCTSDELIMEGLTPLAGNYQAKNIPTVIRAVYQVRSHLKVEQENILSGIRNVVKNTGLLGRWQILGTNPLTICDTGHNREGLEIVLAQLSEIKYDKLRIVLGVVNDKSLDSILPLFPKDAVYYFTRASIPRALDETKLKVEASEYGLSGSAYPTVAEALHQATADASDFDLVFVGGSTFVVAEVV